MKRIILVFLSVIFCFGQTQVPRFVFEYDQNGNRISRERIMVSNKIAVENEFDIANDNAIILFPNPTQGIIKVRFKNASEEAADIVRKAILRKKSVGDVKLIWLQQGIISDEARQLAEENNLEFVEDYCMYVAHQEYLKSQIA